MLVSNQQNQMQEEVKLQIKLKYDYITDEEIDAVFNIALSDYAMIKFPSDNNRPNYEQIEYDFFVSQWLYKRMIDIIDRGGGMSLTAYSENGLDFKYGSSYIDPALKKQLMPKASVPR